MKKIVIAAIIVFIIGISGTVILGGSLFSFGPKVTIDKEESFNANEISTIKVNSDVGDIKISESNNDEIKVKIQGKVSKMQEKHYKFEMKQKGDTLQVVSKKDSNGIFNIPFFSFNSDGKRTIELEVPKGMIDLVDVKTNVGDLFIQELEAKELMVDTDVGDVEVRSFVGQLTSIDSDVGDVTLKSAQGIVDIETDTGGVELEMDEVVADITIESNIGDVDIKINGNLENIGLDLDSDIGDTDVSGGTFLMGTNANGPTIKVRTDIGDITVGK